MQYNSIVTIKRCIIIIILTSVYVVILTVSFMVIGELTFDRYCVFLDFIPDIALKILLMHFFIISSVTFIMYCYIGFVSCRKSCISNPIAPVLPAQQRRSSQKRITKMMVCVLGTYYGTYVPVMTMIVIIGKGAPCSVHNLLMGIFYVNTFINPMIYARANVQFRNAFKKLLRGICSEETTRIHRIAIVPETSIDNF